MRVVLAMTVAGVGLAGLAGCAGRESASDSARSFVAAMSTQDGSALCENAAMGGKAVAGDKDRLALCKDIIAPKIMSGAKGNAALKKPNVSVKENGSTAKATVKGLGSDLTLEDIDGRWLIVIG
ncbi:hypothetical protein [Leifsonia sp. NPDC058248]|uniref:hypothetical protein n=1 Tax=Leifsonia sp. NPDC058248 TaxID=3346402 RepID=UPI0036D823AC